MTLPDPATFAGEWIAAWNRRDIEAVLKWYANDVTFTSPTAVRVVPASGGTVVGKAALRDYWTAAMAQNPGLRFTLEGVYAGVSTVALHYRNQHDQLVVEVLTFDDGLVKVGHATHHLTGS